MREWGTKSYEFTLKKAEISKSDPENIFDVSSEAIGKETQSSAILKTLFRVHCYFGLDHLSKITLFATFEMLQRV
jgi:hypothetical protein